MFVESSLARQIVICFSLINFGPKNEFQFSAKARLSCLGLTTDQHRIWKRVNF